MSRSTALEEPRGTGAFTVNEWCRRYRVSRGTFYKLQREGRGPRLMKIGTATRITPEADAEWRVAQDGGAV
jgi:hypothetical protein